MTDIIIKNLNQNVYYQVKPSKINGIGLFAIKDIPIGTIIINNLQKIQGIYIDKEEATKLNPELLSICQNYFSSTEPNKIFIPSDPNFISTFYLSKYFINHSKKPNCNNHEGNIITIQNIKKGDEITLDYHYNYPQLYTQLSNNNIINNKNKKTKKKYIKKNI